MEKEWGMLKHDSEQVTGDLGDIVVSDANTETKKEENEVMSDEKRIRESLVQENKDEETLQADEAVSEEASKKHHDNDQEIQDEIYVDLGVIPVSEHANTETSNDNEGMQQIRSINSFAKVEHQEIEEAVQENISEPKKINTFDEEAVVDPTDGVCGVDSDGTISEADSNQETEHGNS
ncbi:unnamed protein product [Eruca vesicaria subsp. sativa]|uniref:Uncharacterized protein n=1 Tax=Eruca vesicaria subsp. sativa TaxID=29727 RepID=A0ABC8KHU0_ERUVS|nr:unnamed protein product [Eruca vesicaria subsp. sativa]